MASLDILEKTKILFVTGTENKSFNDRQIKFGKYQLAFGSDFFYPAIHKIKCKQ
jgi:hypothetical protein